MSDATTWCPHRRVCRAYSGSSLGADTSLCTRRGRRARPRACSRIDREYGIHRDRIDLLLRWPIGEGAWQREGIEVKRWADADRQPDPVTRGLAQLDGYLEGLGLDHGWLVIFDQRACAPRLPQRTRFEEHESLRGRQIVTLRA